MADSISSGEELGTCPREHPEKTIEKRSPASRAPDLIKNFIVFFQLETYLLYTNFLIR